MQRAAAGADLEPVGGGDGGADIGLGVAYRVVEFLALGEAGGNRRRPACSRCRGYSWWRCAARQSACRCRPRPEDRRSRGPPAWPPLISTASAPSASSFCRLGAHLVFVARQRRVEQSRRFGQVGREHARARDELAQAVDRVRAQQLFARACDHDRIEHDIARAMPIEAGGNGVDRAALPSMPIFTAPTARSENTASICAAMKSAGTW